MGAILNLVNILICSNKFKNCHVAEEKTKYIGLLLWFTFCFLACIFLIPQASLPNMKPIFIYKSFNFYYQMYGSTLQYVFSQQCIWTAILNIVMQCICTYRKRANYSSIISPGYFVTIVAITYLINCLGHVPMIWKFRCETINDLTGRSPIYLIHPGWFSYKIELIVSWLWLIFGYLVPLTVSVACFLIIKIRLNSADEHMDLRFKRNVRKSLYLVIINISLLITSQTPTQICRFILLLKNTSDSFLIFAASANLLSSIHYAFSCFFYSIIDKSLWKSCSENGVNEEENSAIAL